MIDLHCHSHFSDGILSPAALVQKAIDQQLRCLSLTDHDTLAGYSELYQAAQQTSLQIIRGIEISTRWKKYDIHILGYQINDTPAFQALIQQQNECRIERAKQIGMALAKIGIDDAYDKACLIAGHDRVGRPHFARVLIDEGKTRDMKSAFKQFLTRGKSAYVANPWISVSQAVEHINDAGGQAVIAHPLKYGLTRSKLHELIKEFAAAGGVGIEVVSGEMNVTQIQEMAATANRFHLLASSGSDYHGDTVSRTQLGTQQQLPVNCTPIWHQWNI